jgi:hypothetical protein
MYQTNFVQKIKTHILCCVTFSRKSCRLWDKVERYGTAGQATDDSIIRRMRTACWITKATNTHSEYVIFIDFPRQLISTQTCLECYIMRTLPVWYKRRARYLLSKRNVRVRKQGHCFMWQFASIFVQTALRNDRQRSAHHSSTFPWVGIHTF